ncbi:hypothetical protein LZ30DRAFT_561399, partial [Colletotrichum cereale]
IPLTNDALARLRSAESIHTQARNASLATIQSTSSLQDLPIIRWRNRSFILEQHLTKKKGRGRSSWIKDYGVFLAELLTHPSPPHVGGSFWCCRMCDQRGDAEIFAIASTTSASEHL